MPTARELLEQADALMRRNRAAAGGDGGGIPVLTDRVASTSLETRDGQESMTPPRAPAADNSPGAEGGVRPARSADADELALALDRSLQEEPPVLTDVVEELAVDIGPLPGAKPDDDDVWLGADTVDPALHSVTGPTPDTLAVVPPVTLRAVPPPFAEEHPTDPVEADFSAAPTLRAVGSEPTPAPAGSESEAPEAPTAAPPAPVEGDEERWRALAEQVSMQVLQRLDLFVDAGLKAKLAEHLQPIVARAQTELIEAINEQVGQLVRSYVAEAIEREIAQWRQGQQR